MTESHHFTPTAPLTAALDRGPSQYFHGRTRIQCNFKELLNRAAQAGNGTTFLIQGAPGAGKTALLFECEKHARAREWKVAEIGVRSLWDPNQLLDSLGLGDKYEVTEKSTLFGVKDLLRRRDKSSRPQTTDENILKDGNQPLLLILDEAQRLSGKSAPPKDQGDAVGDILAAIHNGKLGKPVVLLTAGLGTTLNAFGEFGVSRFAEDCLVDLGALSTDSERSVIQDWLKKEDGAQGDPKAWIDAIARETHGWHQHIQSYARRAADQLTANDGVMMPSELSAALEAGREGRKVYYKQRVFDFRVDQLRSLAKPIAAVPQGAPAEYRDIVSSLAQEYGEDGAQDLFKRLEREGLLAQSGMGQWLAGDFGNKSMLVAEYTIGYASTSAMFYAPDKAPIPVTIRLLEKSGQGKTNATWHCWVTDAYDIEVCEPYTGDQPPDPEVCASGTTLEITCVRQDDDGDDGGGGGHCTLIMPGDVCPEDSGGGSGGTGDVCQCHSRLARDLTDEYRQMSMYFRPQCWDFQTSGGTLNFTWDEFMGGWQDGTEYGAHRPFGIMDPFLMNAVQLLRDWYGGPIVLTSGYRCPQGNQDVGGVPGSRHMDGAAVDISTGCNQNYYFALANYAANSLGLSPYGWGIYTDCHLHLE